MVGGTPLPEKNTDVELWRENPGDYYSPRIFATKSGIGIDVGGRVVVMPVRDWFYIAEREARISNFTKFCIFSNGVVFGTLLMLFSWMIIAAVVNQ